MSALALHDSFSRPASLAELKRKVQASAKKQPAVYEFLDASGGTIYVGKAREVRTRLLSYFSAPWPESKSARLVRCAADIRWHYVPSEFAALLEEQRLIALLRPPYNVAGISYRSQLAFIKLTTGIAPRVVVSESARDPHSFYYGPFRGKQATQAAVRTLIDLLGLRDCAEKQPMRFADQPSLFDAPLAAGCIRHELGTCLAPCAARCAKDQYDDGVTQARDFFEGRTAGPMDRLLASMSALVATQEYERAALWRDKFNQLTWLFGALARLRAAIEGLSFVYIVGDRLYVIKHGTIRGEAMVPRTPIERLALAETLRRMSLDTGPVPTAHNGSAMTQLLLVMSWFRRNPEEYENTTPYRRWMDA